MVRGHRALLWLSSSDSPSGKSLGAHQSAAAIAGLQSRFEHRAGLPQGFEQTLFFRIFVHDS